MAIQLTSCFKVRMQLIHTQKMGFLNTVLRCLNGDKKSQEAQLLLAYSLKRLPAASIHLRNFFLVPNGNQLWDNLSSFRHNRYSEMCVPSQLQHLQQFATFHISAFICTPGKRILLQGLKDSMHKTCLEQYPVHNKHLPSLIMRKGRRENSFEGKR